MRRPCALAVIAVLAVPVAASAFELGISGTYWRPEFAGEVRLDGDVQKGTPVDLADDLGVDEEGFFQGEAWLRLGRHRLSLSGVRVEYSGRRANRQEIRFGDEVFVAGGRVESSLEYTMLDLAYRYDLIDLENVLAGFSLGPILQVKYLDGEVELRGEGRLNGATGRVDEAESFRFPIPLVGLGSEVGLVGDWLEARARGVGIGYRDSFLLELQGELSVNPLPFLEVVGGYRHFAIDVDEDEVLLDYRQSGPYVGASLKI